MIISDSKGQVRTYTALTNFNCFWGKKNQIPFRLYCFVINKIVAMFGLIIKIIENTNLYVEEERN